MDADNREKTKHIADLERQLVHPGVPKLDFFAAVRLLDAIVTSQKVVAGTRNSQIRYESATSLASPSNDLIRIKKNKSRSSEKESTEYVVTTTFLSLVGANAAVPLYQVAELAAEEHSTSANRDFLNLFHHRFIALFYKSVTRLQWPETFRSDGRDEATTRILTILGLDERVIERSGLTVPEVLRLGGLISQRSASVRTVECGVRRLIRDEVGAAIVRVIQFTGGRCKLDPSQESSLGRRNNDCGTTFTVGRYVRHPAHQFTIEIGPLSEQNAEKFEQGARCSRLIVGVLTILIQTPGVVQLQLNIVGPATNMRLSTSTLQKDARLVAKDSTRRRTVVTTLRLG